MLAVLKARLRPVCAAILAGVTVSGDWAQAAEAPATAASKLPPPATRQVSFAKDIQPILELNCVACHEGTAANPAHLIPILDGMDAAAIFKQLADYRSGKRLWGVMGAIAKAISVPDSADVAAYFASRTGRLQADSPESMKRY